MVETKGRFAGSDIHSKEITFTLFTAMAWIIIFIFVTTGALGCCNCAGIIGILC